MSLELEIILDFEVKICKILHFVVDAVFIVHIAMSLNVSKILYVELETMNKQHYKMNIISPQGRSRFLFKIWRHNVSVHLKLHFNPKCI
jgi:hypothetical protein